MRGGGEALTNTLPTVQALSGSRVGHAPGHVTAASMAQWASQANAAALSLASARSLALAPVSASILPALAVLEVSRCTLALSYTTVKHPCCVLSPVPRRAAWGDAPFPGSRPRQCNDAAICSAFITVVEVCFQSMKYGWKGTSRHALQSAEIASTCFAVMAGSTSASGGPYDIT